MPLVVPGPSREGAGRSRGRRAPRVRSPRSPGAGAAAASPPPPAGPGAPSAAAPGPCRRAGGRGAAPRRHPRAPPCPRRVAAATPRSRAVRGGDRALRRGWLSPPGCPWSAGCPCRQDAAFSAGSPSAGLQLWGNCCARAARSGGGGPRSPRSSLRAPRARSPGARRQPPAPPRPAPVSAPAPAPASAPWLRAAARCLPLYLPASSLPSPCLRSPPLCFPPLLSGPGAAGRLLPASARAPRPLSAAALSLPGPWRGGDGGGEAPVALALVPHWVSQELLRPCARVRPARGEGRRPVHRRHEESWERGEVSQPESGFSKWAP